MAEYKGIHGTKIQNYTSDPANPITGQVWYNETSQTMKFQYPTTVSAWSTGGNLNTARRSGQSAGTQTAGLFFGGVTPSYTTAVESYDGSSWTTLPATMNTSRQGMAGGGTQTSAIGAGGYGPGGAPAGGVRTLTESWNGTAFTEVADLGTARYRFGGLAPDNTSALVFGGNTTPGITRRAQTESWNGSAWTEVNDLNTARYGLRGAGVPGSALAFGGDNAVPASTGETESWNGTSWTEVSDLNTGRQSLGAAGTSNTASLAFGGAPSDKAITESWNGTSWTEVADMATGREYPSGSGTQAAALATGGRVVSTVSAATEEWNTGIPVGAWSTGGAMITHRDGAGAGIQTAGLIFGGNNPGAGSYDKTELYNGASWTELAATLNSARSSSGGTGTSTSALMFAGYDNGGPLAPLSYVGFTESYNGSAWTEVGDLNTGRQIVGSAGIDNTSALCFGGLTNPGAYGTQTETWNGTSWTEVNNLNTGRYSQGDGTQTSAINAGGYNGSNVANTETWNGTSWTEVNDLNTARRGLGASGTDNTSALFYGGFSTANTGATEEWNGTSFTEVNDLSAAGGGSRNIGTESLALRVSPAPVGSVEEWTKPSFTTKTITSS